MKKISLHLIEFKSTFYYSILSYILTWIVLYSKKEKVLSIYINSNKNYKIIFTNLTEAFFTYIKISFFTAFLFTLPIILLLIFLYIRSALYKYEEFIIRQFILGYIGIIYPWIILKGIPFIINFSINYFQNYQLNIYLSSSIEMLLKFSDLWEFISNLILLSIIFSISPLFFIFLFNNKNIPIEKLSKKLKKKIPNLKKIYKNYFFYNLDKKNHHNNIIWFFTHRHLFYYFLFFFLAILTPPDLLSLFIISLPLILTIEIILFFLCCNINIIL